MTRIKGFTLIELLVVVAIISILAGIIIPNVTGYIARARAARALSEIKGAELSLTKMLTDANKSHFGQFFDPGTLSFNSLVDAEDFYTEAFYILLKNGKTAGVPGLRDEVRRKLSDSYINLTKDPWGNLYHFYAGPLKLVGNPSRDVYYLMPFRSYEVDETVPGSLGTDDLSLGHTEDARPIGYPAPAKLPVYIYSCGADAVCAQAMYQERGLGPAAYDSGLPDDDSAGGGDDINNWDNEQSWSTFY